MSVFSAAKVLCEAACLHLKKCHSILKRITSRGYSPIFQSDTIWSYPLRYPLKKSCYRRSYYLIRLREKSHSNATVHFYKTCLALLFTRSMLKMLDNGDDQVFLWSFFMPLTRVCPLSALFNSTYTVKSCLKVSFSLLNKALVGGFPCSRCGFRAVGCHFHLLFHGVGVTKPPEILPVTESCINRPYFFHCKHKWSLQFVNTDNDKGS